ncbi:hypothetical protein HDU79_007179 [Rhizoclosmatium sp. JEL0117]|nr:hypothetical protein HDU79_007179 [Rhizoclosmatium sp. JEL0117]
MQNNQHNNDQVPHSHKDRLQTMLVDASIRTDVEYVDYASTEATPRDSHATQTMWILDKSAHVESPISDSDPDLFMNISSPPSQFLYPQAASPMRRQEISAANIPAAVAAASVLLEMESIANTFANAAPHSQPPIKPSITADRLPPITNRISLTAQRLSEVQNPHPIQPPQPPAQLQQISEDMATTNPPNIVSSQHHNNNNSQRNIATHLPSSNHTSRFLYQQPLPASNPSHDPSPKSNPTSQQPHYTSQTPTAPSQPPHRRVASARTAREQDHHQTRHTEKTRQKAAIAVVKNHLNFGAFSPEVSNTAAAVKQTSKGSSTSGKTQSAAAASVFDEKEVRRVMAVHGMRLWGGPKEPRFDTITSLTARLLSAEICTITIVDTAAVRYWSLSDTPTSAGKYFPLTASQEPWMIDEARGDSFCQYVIREEDGGLGGGAAAVAGGNSSSGSSGGYGGFVVLDASREARFRGRALVAKGLCFYAGAPLVLRSGVKIGALSIRGPARTHFTSQEAKILRQMTEWAIGEFELYVAKRDLDFRESLRLAQDRLAEIQEAVLRGASSTSGGDKWTCGRGVVKSCIEVVKVAAKLKNVMILKMKKNTEGIIRSTVFALADKCEIKAGDEKFTELCQATLDKPGPGPYLLDRSHSVASQLQVCRYIGEHVRQSASELIWSHGRPVGVIVFFFEGTYRTVSTLDEQFLVSSAITLSRIWQYLETQDSLSKSMNPSTYATLLVNRLKQSAAIAKRLQNNSTVTATTKSHFSLSRTTTPPIKSYFSSQSTLYQSQNSLAVTTQSSPETPTGSTPLLVLLCEAILPPVKGNLVSEATSKASLNATNALFPNSATGLTSSNALHRAFGSSRSLKSKSVESLGSTTHKRNQSTTAGGVEEGKGIWGGTTASTSLTPRGTIDLLSDFAQMVEVVAGQVGVRWVKKCGCLFVAIVGLDDESLSKGITIGCSNLVALAKNLSQTLAEYAGETGIDVTARIGIHGELVPFHVAESVEAAEKAWTLLG